MALALTAGASAAADVDPQAAASSAGLEEIVVTAQRRSENLQNVPITVTALTAAALERADVTTTTQLQQVTPGLTWTSTNRSSLPFIRGVGSSDSSVGSENSVALYIDGVYIDSSPASNFAFNNIERIEVLKGPQGTLFGRNATGGLIQIITKDPSTTFGGNVEVGYDNYQTTQDNLYVTGPISDKLAADLAVVYTNQGQGWGRNVNTGTDIDQDHNIAARSKWLLDLEDTKFTLALDYSRERTDIGSERNLPPGAVNPGLTTHRGGFYDSQSDIDPVGMLRQAGISLHGEHTFSLAKFTSITAYRDTFYSNDVDQDETPLRIFDAYFNQVRIRTFTQEFQLASGHGETIDWIAGTFYMHRHGFQPYILLTGLAFAGPPFRGFGKFDDGVTTSTGAPFGQVTWHISPTTDLTGGFRYTVEHQEFAGDQTNAAGGVVAAVDTSVTYQKATFRAALDHHFTDDLMVYGSFNRGFKGGVYNVNALTAPPARPEQIDAYEAGLKSDFLDRRLRINAAVFHYNYKDIQLLVAPAPGSGQISTTINAAKAKLTGLDLSIDAVPVDRLTLSFGASYLPTAEYESFFDAPLFVTKPVGGNILVPFDGSGNRMIRAPRFAGTASADYVLPTAAGDFDAAVNVYRSSSFAWNPDARYLQAAYALVGGKLGYKVRDSGIRASLWAQNIFNKQYDAGLSETTSGDAYIPAAPRTYGIKVGYEF